MMDFIERLRGKPAHVRKQIAFGTAASFTGLIALIWVTAFTASGALSRTPEANDSGITSTFAEANGASLLGAIGSLTTRSDGSIMVVGTQSSSTAEEIPAEERTVIPF